MSCLGVPAHAEQLSMPCMVLPDSCVCVLRAREGLHVANIMYVALVQGMVGHCGPADVLFGAVAVQPVLLYNLFCMCACVACVSCMMM